jgi:Zn-dependent M28 family amino/carboxypeptidase
MFPNRPRITVLALASLLVGATAGTAQTTAAADVLGERPRIDGPGMIDAMAVLAHDSLEGRRVGTPGAERARSFLLREFEQRGLVPVGAVRTQEFEFTGRGGTTPTRGVNVMGMVRGTVHPDRYIVVSAHYDHLGIRNGQVYNGADDDASGTAALLALGEWIREHPQRHSLIFVAFDAEESGLRGARAFVANPPVPIDRVLMNVNLDMVSRSPRNELFAVGTRAYPYLRSYVDEAARLSKIELLTGHEGPGLPPGDDWTDSSDHGPFNDARIPFIYLGVEDHPGYHQPSDDVQDITREFYVEAMETALDLLLILDRNGEKILEARGR